MARSLVLALEHHMQDRYHVRLGEKWVAPKMQFNRCRHIIIAVPLMIPTIVEFDKKSATIPSPKTDWQITVKIELRYKWGSVSGDMFS